MEQKLEKIREYGRKIKSILELNSYPVGVKILKKDDIQPDNAERLTRHRYCQAVMKARHGKDVFLSAEELSCPAAKAAFGFAPLPAGLECGKGLIGFGIVSDAEIGQAMFENMPTLSPGEFSGIHLFPVDTAPEIPDVIVVEDQVEKLMWILLSSMHYQGGQRTTASTAILQAACVDSTIIPYIDQKINFSFGCYGCRDATDIGGGETILGFPLIELGPITAHLEFLNSKAITVSRSKKALSNLNMRASEKKY